MTNSAEFEKIPIPPDAIQSQDDKDYQDTLRTDKEHQQRLERQEQNMGSLGKVFGRSTDTEHFGRDVILGFLMILAITITHITDPEHSALIPALAGLLGFVGGTRYSQRR